MNSGKLIRDLRIEKGLTQEDLAHKSGISVRTIQRIESNKISPRIYTLQAIADALGVSYQYLSENISIEEEEQESPEKDKIYRFMLHFSGVFDLIFPPLLVWLIFKDKLKGRDEELNDILNFQISMFLYLVISGILTLIIIGLPFAIFFGFYSLIIIIINSIRVLNNRPYKYPLSIKFIRKSGSLD